MQLTMEGTATYLGKSKWRVLHIIQTGRLSAEKAAGRRCIDSHELPLTEAQQRSAACKQQQFRSAVKQALVRLQQTSLTCGRLSL